MDVTELAKPALSGKLIAIEHDLRDQLTDMVMAASQTKVAIGLGISVSYLNDIIHGRKLISYEVADRLGWKQIKVYVKDKE